MGVLALSAQSVVEALAGAALHPRLGSLLVSMETTQSGLEPCQTRCRFVSNTNQDVIIEINLITAAEYSMSHQSQ